MNEETGFGIRSLNCLGPLLPSMAGRWQFELKDRASADSRRRPNPTVVAFDDRVADRKAHSHAMLLRREKCLEDAIKIGRINSRSSIFDRHMYHASLVSFGSHLQHALLNRMHRLDGINDQVQNHLLQLDLVADYGGKPLIEFSLKVHAVLPQIDPHNIQNRQNKIIDVDRSSLVHILFEHRANACDDVACAMTGGLDLI